MSDRKKWGVILMITGIVSLAVGIITFFTASTPVWLPQGLAILTFILNAVGLPLAFIPDPK
jgi:hypothetical protein